MIQLLDCLLNKSAAAPYRRVAYAQAHYALALLYYGARQPAQARRHLWRSFVYQPQQTRERQWRLIFLKSLLPARLIQLFRTKEAEN
jgi:hypothetical protein